ncbi:MAG: ribonuclease HII [Thermodesulfobacteriaceae bacterium]|nr:ribonuclease HII [Thermodesulfobacteriaceae bacterium]MCX8041787.1 ribonuclease HII [Thermodesulfobacteriaceae bacterium]MDW8135204.1 ribonuclease HII [Thermodesulfobacterium sp.]
MKEFYFRNLGFQYIAGIDEAGRGAIAGPIFASAVILPWEFFSLEIKDSKLLSTKKREKLFKKICKEALSFSIAKAEVEEINQLGVLKATFLAMKRSLEGLDLKPDLVLIDGPFTIPDYRGKQKALVKGDKIYLSISAASILAKVARDKYMENLSFLYPEYQFDKHKGYPTKDHLKKIEKYGVSEVHRKNFKIFINFLKKPDLSE